MNSVAKKWWVVGSSGDGKLVCHLRGMISKSISEGFS